MIRNLWSFYCLPPTRPSVGRMGGFKSTVVSLPTDDKCQIFSTKSGTTNVDVKLVISSDDSIAVV